MTDVASLQWHCKSLAAIDSHFKLDSLTPVTKIRVENALHFVCTSCYLHTAISHKTFSMFFYIIINVFIAKYDIISGLYSPALLVHLFTFALFMFVKPSALLFLLLIALLLPMLIRKKKQKKTSVAHIFAHHATNFLPNYVSRFVSRHCKGLCMITAMVNPQVIVGRCDSSINKLFKKSALKNKKKTKKKT